MKAKIILIALIAFGALASLAFTQTGKKNMSQVVENKDASKSCGFVSEEI